MTLTPSQAKVLGAILRHLEKHGWAPTLREIADACGWRAEASALNHVRNLVSLGYLATHTSKNSKGRSRAIRVLRDVNGRRVRIGLHHIAEEA